MILKNIQTGTKRFVQWPNEKKEKRISTQVMKSIPKDYSWKSYKSPKVKGDTTKGIVA